MSAAAGLAAVVLAAGQGRRMNSKVQKQYLLLGGKPVLYYSLKAFEESPVDEIILVTGSGEEEYCRREIVERFGFRKVAKITAGGRERYHSVYRGIQAADPCGVLLIHDGARPFLTQAVIERACEGAKAYGACVAAMPVKDTVRIAGGDGLAVSTPNRRDVWLMQTPQAFAFDLVREAYEGLMEREEEISARGIQITDDAMVVETILNKKVRLVEGSYGNIKITTPEDLILAEALMKQHDFPEKFRF